jgi:hypothetical protein
MSFWSNLFSKKKDDDAITIPNDQSSSNAKESVKVDDNNGSDNEGLTFDEGGWLTYPDGLKLRNVSGGSFTDDNLRETMSALGYHTGECFISLHDKNGKETPTDYVTIGLWELFTDKLICLVRTDGKVLSDKEIEKCKDSQWRKWHREFDLKRGIETLRDIIEGVKYRSISQQFVERVFECKSDDENKLTAGRFEFEFTNGFLSIFSYEGYIMDVFEHFDLSTVVQYSSCMDRNWDAEEKLITLLTNYQAICLEKIDKAILESNITCKKFTYPKVDEDEVDCINYIAIATFYKQHDVREDVFMKSTGGDYEIISKTVENGVTTTKIKAYGEIFTFMNGHSIPDQVFSVGQTPESYGSGSQGYVYVMVNPSLPDMVKIGMTTKDPNERAKELSTATGVPTPFMLVFYKPFIDCYSTEQRIHQFLEDKGYRVNNNREFFNIPTKLAIDVVQAYYNLEQEELKQQ